MIIPAVSKILDQSNLSIQPKAEVNHAIDIMSLAAAPKYMSSNIYEEYYDDDKAYVRFVKMIERSIRGSSEMKKYMSYLKRNMKMDNCAILNGVSMEEVAIELHHYPFTLFDITSIVLQSYIRNNKSYSTISIANEVVKIHYENIIGLIPLSKTIHELAHAGEVFIPLQQVYGNYKEFISRYNSGMYSEHLTMLKQLIKMSTDEASQKRNLQKLTVKPVQWQIVDNRKPINDLSFLVEDKSNILNDNAE